MKNLKQKVLMALLLLFTSIPAYAIPKSIPIAWDYGDDSMLACFTVYAAKAAPIVYEARDVAQWSYDVSPTDRTASVAVDMLEGETVFIVLTASGETGKESGFSNQVSFFLPITPPPVVTPKVPTNLRVL